MTAQETSLEQHWDRRRRVYERLLSRYPTASRRWIWRMKLRVLRYVLARYAGTKGASGAYLPRPPSRRRGPSLPPLHAGKEPKSPVQIRCLLQSIQDRVRGF